MTVKLQKDGAEKYAHKSFTSWNFLSPLKFMMMHFQHLFDHGDMEWEQLKFHSVLI